MAICDKFEDKIRIVLNPAYLLRQDGTRALIVSENEEEYNVRDSFSFINPVHAQILSFFKGRKEFELELDECISTLSIPKQAVLQLLTPLIENKNWVKYISKSGHVIHFPPRTLIRSEETVKRRTNHYFYEFELYNSPDYTTDRLAYPIKVMLDLSMRCYVNCEYCYAKRKGSMLDTIPTGEMISLIRQLKKDGALQIDINGGEVLLYPGIRDILVELSSLGYEPLISTKMPLDTESIDFLKDLPGVKLQISLDSVEEEILHQLIKAPLGYIDKMSDSLEYMSVSGMKIRVNCVITKYNCSIPKITSLIHFLNRYSCIKGMSLTICGFSLYKQNYESLRLTHNEALAIENKLDEWKALSSFPVILGGYDKMSMYSSGKSWESYSNRALCTGNIRNIVILPNGDVTVCEELYDNPAFVLGNIREKTLKEIWNGEKAVNLYEKAYVCSSYTPCQSCPDMMACRKERGVCWKTVLMAYGEDKWNYPDPRCPRAPLPFREFCIDDI